MISLQVHPSADGMGEVSTSGGKFGVSSPNITIRIASNLVIQISVIQGSFLDLARFQVAVIVLQLSSTEMT
jgi:hypothetical protein